MPLPEERNDERTEGMERSQGGIEKLSWKSHLGEQIKEEIN